MDVRGQGGATGLNIEEVLMGIWLSSRLHFSNPRQVITYISPAGLTCHRGSFNPTMLGRIPIMLNDLGSTFFWRAIGFDRLNDVFSGGT